MKTLKNLFLLTIPLYFTFVIITMNRFDESNTVEEYSGVYLFEKQEMMQRLLNDFDAVDPTNTFQNFTAELQKYILQNNVILDSSVISTSKLNDQFFVNLQISMTSKKVFARLKCDEEMYDAINNFKFVDALVVADISSVKVLSFPVEIFIDDETYLANLGEDIILSGNCIEAIELASF